MSFEPIHHLVRRAIDAHGARTAVSEGGRRTTYAELGRRAAAVRDALAAEGVGRGAAVAILADSSRDVIASILGVLEVGGVFVPLDRDHPAGRLEAIVAEAKPAAWLLAGGAAHRAGVEGAGVDQATGGVPAIDLDALPEAAGGLGDGAPAAGPDDPAYVYFTSGSTGRPKGIVGRLKGIDHFIRWEVETFGLGPESRVSQLTTPAFDAFLRDAFAPLAAGGTVCAPESRDVLLDGRRLVAWLEEEGVTLVHCTPSLFRSLLGQPLGADSLPALSHVLLAGEPLLPSDVARWRAAVGGRIELVNLYGPSETTMVKLFHRVRAEDAEGRSVPIGQPMPGARAIVVDERDQACPPGKMGEILIRTPYRTLGYLDRPELTAAAFVPNPFTGQADDLVYRTGDLGRVLEDGSFEYVGRRDGQVKVRGVRVELEPIEDLLRGHPQVAEAVVAARTDTQGNRYLCAWVVAGEEVTAAVLAEFLRERLPDAMVPSAFVALPELPRTLSGKVDRRALPDPGRGGGRMAGEYVAPRTPVEERLCDLYGELLGLEKVGIRSSFFELGGHSLLATLLLSRIRAGFGVEVPLRQVFRTPEVEGLALAVTELQLAAEGGADEVEALLGEVAALSDEELDELLDETAPAAAGRGEGTAGE